MLIDIILKEGEHIKAEGNQPVTLSNDKYVWFVNEGHVDIFYVENSDRSFKGARRHIVRVNKNQLIFDIHSQKDERIEMLAVGVTGTRLVRFETSKLQALVKEEEYAKEIADLIDHWVTNLSISIQNTMPPIMFNPLQAGEQIILSENGHAQPQKGIVWVKHLEGYSKFIGKDNLFLKDNVFFPISSKTWIKTAGQSKMVILDTESHLIQDPSWLGLNQFHQLVLDCISRNLDEEYNEEKARLITKAQTEKSIITKTFAKLTVILNKKESKDIFDKNTAEPFFAACQLIGKYMGIEFLRPPANKNTPEHSLDAIANSSGIRFRQVALKGKWWKQDNGPLLSFRENNKNPVALIPLSPHSYFLWDPAEGLKKKIDEKTAESFQSFAYMFYKPFPNTKLTAFDLLKIGFQGNKKDLISIITMGACGAILSLIIPVATGIIFDTIIPEALKDQLTQITVILLICAFAVSVFEFTKNIAMIRLETKMDFSIQASIWDRLLSLPVPFFRNYLAGDLADRSMGISTIHQVLSGITIQSLMGGIFSFFSLILLFWYNWKLSLVAIGLVLCGMLITVTISYVQIKYKRQMIAVQGRLMGMVLQFISGIGKIRIAAGENRAFSVWAEDFRKKKELAFKSGVMESLLSSFNAGFPTFAFSVIFIWIALQLAKQLINGDNSISPINTGTFLAFFAAYTNFQTALLQMSKSLTDVLNIIPLYERAKPIIETLPERHQIKAQAGTLSGNIEINNATFQYHSNSPLILNDISFQIQSGEFVALVGPSGSGKSTILRLLLGFEKLNFGTIYYDNKDLAILDIREVRQQTGTVLQNSRLLPGDIFRNIIGTSRRSIEEAWDAAKMVGLDDDIKRMPMEMNTIIALGSSTLSEGQKQRILIARAIVNKPRMLFFDEATSALDNRTQEIVSHSLEHLKVTRLVIAHRLSTIINADKIYVLDKGSIVQMGTYYELIRKPGLFSEMAERQIV